VGLLHAAGEVDAACIAVVDAAGEVDAATPWDLGMSVGGASSDGLTGDVALHAAGLADAPSVCVHAGARVARKRWRSGSRGGGWEWGRGGRLAARGGRRRVRQVEVGGGAVSA
jgi:hypothetical protein